MDPFVNVPLDLHSLIFQHLAGNDIKEMFEVSEDWHEKTAKSPICMNKIKFSMSSWKRSIGTKQQESADKIETLQNSTRNYKSVAIDCRFDKNLSLQFWKFLEVLSDDLVELKIKSCKLDDPTPLKLKKLEILKLTCAPTRVRNLLITSTRNLKRLKLKMVSPLIWSSMRSDRDSSDSIRKFLSTNHELKDLELHGGMQYNTFFDADFSLEEKKPKFNLKNLKVKNGMRLALISEQNEENLINFLKTQSSTIEKFFIDVCRQNVIQHVFNHMPLLTSLHIDTMMMDEFKVKDLQLMLNERIVDLSIPYVSQQEDIIDFLSMTPNLHTLFVAHLSHETMEFIAFNLNSLRILKFRYDEIDCEDFYETLRDENPDVNQDIQMVVDYDYA